MADTNIGYAVLQVIPSLKGVTEAINKELDGKVIDVQIEPKTDAAKVEKSVKDAVKKKPVEVELEPKVDKSKIDSAVKDAEKKAKPPEVHLDPKIDPKKIEQTVEDAVKKTRGSKFELPEFKLPEFNARDIGTKLRGAVVKGLDELNNNPALKDVQEQVGKEVGAAIGKKIGETLRGSAIGREVADAFQPVIDKAGEAQQKFGPLKESIEGSTTGLLTLTNNSGKIAGGLTAISGAAGPLAGVFATLTTLMPGFQGAMDSVLSQIQGKQGFDPKAWFNFLAPGTNLIDRGINEVTEPFSGPRGITSPIPAKPGVSGLAPGSTPAFEAPIDGVPYQARPGSLDPFAGAGVPTGPSNPAPMPVPVPVVPVPVPVAPTNLPKLPSMADLTSPIPGRASGGIAETINGMIRGPGTGTSDSILGFPATVRVSAGEFITNADDTRKNLPLLQAVNSGVPLWDWLKKIPQFGDGGLVPGAQQLRKIIMERFGISDIGGYRAPDGFNEHSTGRALDVMVGSNKAKGDAVKDFALSNAAAIDLKWAIWQQRMWYPGGKSTLMTDRGSPTQNHMDHVHIFSGPGITNGLLGALQGQSPGNASTPVGLRGPGDVGAAAVPAGAVPAATSTAGGSAGGSFGGFSLPSSFGDLAGFGLSGLGQGIGTTKSGSDLSLFGNAAASAVSGQVNSALSSFGIPGAPRWLQGIAKFASGISIGGGPGGGSASPASAAIGAIPSAAAAAIPSPAGMPDSVKTVGGMPQAGNQTVFNIQTARVEDAFVLAQQREKEKAAAKLDRWT